MAVGTLVIIILVYVCLKVRKRRMSNRNLVRRIQVEDNEDQDREQNNQSCGIHEAEEPSPIAHRNDFAQIEANRPVIVVNIRDNGIKA